MAKMFINTQNMIVEEALGTRLFDDPPRREPCELNIGDFDGAKLKVVCDPDSISQVCVHICLNDLGRRLKEDLYGQEHMDTVFAGMQTEPIAGFDFAVRVECEGLTGDEAHATLSKVANIRMHLMSAPYVKAFNVMKDGGDLPLLHFNQNNVRLEGGLGAVFIKTAPGLVTVIHALSFPDETDTAIARVMMQMFAKEGKKVNGAPPVNFYEIKNPPTELAGEDLSAYQGCAGFAAFVIFPQHIDNPAKLTKSATMMATFRNYIHYHIKASKTYLHMRMRSKVHGWLQLLNQAAQELPEKEKKTSGGKVFKRG